MDRAANVGRPLRSPSRQPYVVRDAPRPMRTTEDGTQTPIAAASAETREAIMEAVREAKGRRAIRPALTIDAALLDLESHLAIPAWAAAVSPAAVAADALREVYVVDVYAGDGALAWALYTEAARHLGFPCMVPVPVFIGAG